jgi:outer membrane protein insertion porin family
MVNEGVRTREERADAGNVVEETGGSSADATRSSTAQEIVHNLAMATSLIQQGDEMGAAFVPLRLSSIRIEGAQAMRPSFLSRICRPYVDTSLRPPSTLNRWLYGHRLDQVLPGQQTSLPGLLGVLASIGTDVGSLEAIADVSASLEPSRMDDRSTLETQQQDVDVVLRCKMRPRLFIKSSTDVGNGEGNAAIQAQLRNVFGGAETADFQATVGTRTRRAFNGSLSWPVFAMPEHRMTLSAYAQDRDLSSFASATEGAQGIRLALLLSPSRAASPFAGTHELAYEMTHRHLGRMRESASLGIRRLGGHSVKSALSHSYTFDIRDAVDVDNASAALPLLGTMVKALTEYAGLGGDANHIKTEVELQSSRCMGDAQQYGFTFSSRFGCLATLNGRNPAFSDRFQLGGPTSVRMFRYNSLGPKSGLDSMGGEVYAALGSSFFAPLWPGKSHWPLKWHAFFNAGQLAQLDHRSSSAIQDWTINNGRIIFNEVLSRPSCSAGLGLVFRQAGLRAEVNVGVPLVMRKGDGARTGLQLGIGIDFL